MQDELPESTVSDKGMGEGSVTIGEALEATALVLGHFTNH
jgi:hypothetical protein